MKATVPRFTKILNIKKGQRISTIFMHDGKIAIIKEGIVSEILDLKIKKLNSFTSQMIKLLPSKKMAKLVFSKK